MWNEEERYADTTMQTDEVTNWQTDALTERFNCRTVCLSVSGRRRVIRRGLLESTAQIALLYWARKRLSTLSTVSRLSKPSSAAAAAAAATAKSVRARKRVRESAEERAADSSCWATTTLSRCVCACVRGFVSHCVIYYQQTIMAAMPVTSRESERASARERHR